MKKKILEQFYRFKHLYYSYIGFFIRYFTFKKLFNALFNTCEYLAKKVSIHSIPPVIHFDVCNSCVLHCPLCATGRGDKSQTKAIMKFEDFKNIFDQVKEETFFVWLYNWGEPFLCRDIFKIIDYCHHHNVGVKLDSNLNYHTNKILKNIVRSKIDYLSLSIDGFTQKNYQFYRRGGNLPKVLEGIKRIQALKRKFRTKYPILVWQFLINNKNKNEVTQAQKWALENKVDVFEARPLSLLTEVDSQYRDKEYKEFLSETGVSKEAVKARNNPRHCRYLWDSFAVNPDGSFAPCPVIYKDADIFGRFEKHENNIREIVNSEVFIESRKLFRFKKYKPKYQTPCLRCDWYTKPH